MKPKRFKNMNIYAGFHPQNGMEWQKPTALPPTGKHRNTSVWKPVYTKEDLEGGTFELYHQVFLPISVAHTPMMYTFRPWTIRQYAGFSTAEESNAFHRRNLASGQKGLSVVRPSDPPWLWPRPSACSRRCQVKRVYPSVHWKTWKFVRRHSLEQDVCSMTMNGAVLPIMAFYINAGLEQGRNWRNGRNHPEWYSERVHGA